MLDKPTTAPKIFAVAMAATLLAACGGSGGESTAKTGALTLGITDAAIDYADELVVQFSGVELKPKGGASFVIDFATPKSLDLLELQGTNRAVILDGEVVPAGEYEWLRLKVNADPNVGGDSWLRREATGEMCELRIPSGAETGLKLVRGFTVGVGTTTDFTVDFDLRKSVVAPPGQSAPTDACAGQAYLLKPALRIVDNLQVGAIAGSVDAGLVATRCTSPSDPPYPGRVYLFGPRAADAVITPDDDDGIENDQNGADAITSAIVDEDTFGYTIGFVPAGNYVVAYTCDLDDPEVDSDAAPVASDSAEAVAFTPTDGIDVSVTAGQIVANVDFAAPTQ
jgi:hypothetical protein